jgi:hypothetical protein
MSLIQEIAYGLPGALPPHRSYELRVSPTSGSAATYITGGIIQISVPRIDRSFFQNNTGYITGRCTFTTATGTANLKYLTSGGAYSLFSKYALRTANGQQLDNIDNPGFIFSMLCNLGVSPSQKEAYANNFLFNQNSAGSYPNIGIGFAVGAGNAGQNLILDFAIPMLGAWNSDKYWPAFGNELLIELTVGQLANCVIETNNATGAAAGFTLSNIEFVSQILEFSPETFSQMQQLYSNGIQIKSETYRFGSWPFASGISQGQMDIPFNIRNKSLKRLFMAYSPSNACELNGYSAVNPNLNSYVFVLNGVMYPQRPVQELKPAETFNQIIRAHNGLYTSDKPTCLSLEGHRMALTAYITNVYQQYNSTIANITSQPNMHYLVLDLESISNHKEGLYAGIDTTGSTANTIRLDCNTASTQAAILNYFGCADCIISFDFVNGITNIVM